ncbi:unnamed protein product [Ixodes pacificus]
MDLFPVSFCTCVHPFSWHCLPLSPFLLGKVPVDQHIQHPSLRVFCLFWPFMFEYTLVWVIKGNEDQYNGTMLMHSDGRRGKLGCPSFAVRRQLPRRRSLLEKGPLPQ